MEKRSIHTKSAGFVPGLSKVLLPGDMLDNRYELLELLGDGGMGRVYKAKHLVLDTVVALKVLHYRGVNDVVSKERFLSEVRSMKVLDHERIPKVFDAGMSLEGYYYLVTEYLEGETLKSWIAHHEDRNEIYLKQAVDYIMDVCDGVMVAHEQGIVHRDLKPSNIFLSRDRYGDACPKILDFGLAVRPSESDNLNEAVGTEGYMSPEQKAGIETDARTDVYGLGVILYEAITGILPEKNKNDRMFSRSDKSLHTVTPPSRINQNVPKKLDRICLIALERDASDRYQTVVALSDALCAIWPTNKVVQKKRESHKTFIIWSAAALVFICAVGLSWRLGVSHGTGLKRLTEKSSAAVVEKPDTVRTTVASKMEVKSSSLEIIPSTIEVKEKAVASTVEKKKDASQAAPNTASLEKSAEKSKAGVQVVDIGKDKEQVNGLIEEGNKELRAMRLDKAEDLFQGALEIVPSEPRALFGLGRVMFEKEQYRLAAVRMEAALRQRNDAEWRLNLGSSFYKLGKQDLAVKEWKRVIADFPNDKSALLAESYLQDIVVDEKLKE